MIDTVLVFSARVVELCEGPGGNLVAWHKRHCAVPAVEGFSLPYTVLQCLCWLSNVHIHWFRSFILVTEEGVHIDLVDCAGFDIRYTDPLGYLIRVSGLRKVTTSSFHTILMLLIISFPFQLGVSLTSGVESQRASLQSICLVPSESLCRDRRRRFAAKSSFFTL
eukprot:9489106-Pyramimonas_sp.AAC.1